MPHRLRNPDGREYWCKSRNENGSPRSLSPRIAIRRKPVIEMDMEQLAMEQYNISTILMYQRIMTYRQNRPLNSHYYRSESSSDGLDVAPCSCPEISSSIIGVDHDDVVDEEGIFPIDLWNSFFGEKKLPWQRKSTIRHCRYVDTTTQPYHHYLT
jgi:hypothetical protein